MAKVSFNIFALILSVAIANTFASRNDAQAKPTLEAHVGDQVTVTTSDTTIPLPATIIAIAKNKYTVQMLPSYQFKGSERFQVSARQIKLVFPADAPRETKAKIKETAGTKTTLTASATAGTKAKSLSGLYTRFGQSFEGKTMICKEEQFYFFPDGRVYHALPPQGPAHLDWSKTLKDSPSLCGNYGIIGDTIVFQWNGDSADQHVSWKLKHRGNNLELNGMVADKAANFPSNAKIDGTYSRQEIIVIEGKPITSPVKYTFSADGKFSLEQKDKTQTAQKLNGSYQLSGNDIEFNVGTARSSSSIYPQHLDNRSLKSPDRLSINGKLFERMQ